MREFHVLNLGAGVQSTCLFLLAREPDADLRFDVAVFADTGEEPAAVYKHLDYLRSLGQPEIWIRSGHLAVNAFSEKSLHLEKDGPEIPCVGENRVY